MTDLQNKGNILEFAAKLYFANKYGKDNVFFWKEFAKKKQISIQDLGVDLVVIIDNEPWAVQCKNWNKRVDYNSLGSYVGELFNKNTDFKGGFLVTSGLTINAENKFIYLNKQVIAISASELEPYIDQAENLLNSGIIETEPTEKKELRPYQIEAIESVLKGFEENDRGKLIMPPGTGKTLVALRIAENYGTGKLILFLCPSIALLDQTLKVWQTDTEIGVNAYAVVSDKSVGKKQDELNSISLLSFPATTNDVLLMDKFNLEEDKLNVIFSTYQSLDVIKEAHGLGLPEFDLIVCDEAHKTAGVSADLDTNFKLVHNNDIIKGKKRLYMTATPKVFDINERERKKIEEESMVKVFDMSDDSIFGPNFYEYSFKKAIEEGYLSPYRIVILDVNKKDVQNKLASYLINHSNIDRATKLVGLSHLIRGSVLNENNQALDIPIKSGIVFTSRIDNSKSLASEFSDVYREYFNEYPKYLIQHIDGTMSAFDKREKIDWLRMGTQERPNILSNAKVLTEGIDVPNLDFVAFLDPKDSVVDIIQAIGRVVRKAEGKEYGLIFIPLIVDTEKENIDERMESSSYKTLWRILNALSSLDSAFKSQSRLTILDIENTNQNKEYTEKSLITFVRPEITDDQKTLFDEVRKHLKTKIARSFRLGSIFLRDWAAETTKIADALKTQVKIEIDKSTEFKNKFEQLEESIRTLLNENISEDESVSLIVQYLLTKPILDSVFSTKSDADKILDEIFDYFKTFIENNSTKNLEKFYEEVQDKASGLQNENERQEFVRHLYSNFFNVAFKDTADEMGIAYTPVELASFVVKFSDFLVKKHFNKRLEDEGVVVLEPFAGTGTFAALAIDSISSDKIKAKLERKEIWANEILLLPYMTMVKNIESVIKNKTGEDTPFNGALWTDSFQLMEKIYKKEHEATKMYLEFPNFIPIKYKELVSAQMEAKVNVIISNPPWRGKKENENVGSRNVEYEELRKRINNTYVKNCKNLGVNNTNSLYDTYIQAMRMATDRVKEGVIGLVLNNGWLNGLAGRGVRKSLIEEFSEIYIYDLRGDSRKSREESKKDGEQVFGNQSRAGVCLLFLVKKLQQQEKGKFYYCSVKDYAKRNEKLNELKEQENKLAQIQWTQIIPDEKYDWLEQGNKDFENLIKLGDKKNKNDLTVFDTYSRGVATTRDAYVYNYFYDELKLNMTRIINNFNQHLTKVKNGEITKNNLEDKIIKDQKQIKWDANLKDCLFLKSVNYQVFEEKSVHKAYYRPFVPMFLYFDKFFNSRRYCFPQIFPFSDAKNIAIIVSGVGKGMKFSSFMADKIVDLNYFAPTQVFPLYSYKEITIDNKNDIFADAQDNQKKELVRVDNITDESLNKFKTELNDESITKDDIFYYVYGILQTPAYVEKYQNNLAKELPRVPIVQNFKEISKIGRELADIHLNYQNLEEYNELKIEGEQYLQEKVEKVKLDKKEKTIEINKKIKVSNIPNIAFEYRVGNYAPIEWISRYLIKQTDEDTGITWDPNISAEEFITLAKKLITLSLKTTEIKTKLEELYTGFSLLL